jgi:hypothetical protein
VNCMLLADDKGQGLVITNVNTEFNKRLKVSAQMCYY